MSPSWSLCGLCGGSVDVSPSAEQQRAAVRLRCGQCFRLLLELGRVGLLWLYFCFVFSLPSTGASMGTSVSSGSVCAHGAYSAPTQTLARPPWASLAGSASFGLLRLWTLAVHEAMFWVSLCRIPLGRVVFSPLQCRRSGHSTTSWGIEWSFGHSPQHFHGAF